MENSMRNRLAPLGLLTLLLSAHLTLPAQEQDKAVRKKPGRTTYANITLEATEAKGHVGEEATVCGKVVSTRYLGSARGTPTFLNFEKPYPDHVFTVVVWGRNRGEFGEPERKYKDVVSGDAFTRHRHSLTEAGHRAGDTWELKSSASLFLRGETNEKRIKDIPGGHLVGPGYLPAGRVCRGGGSRNDRRATGPAGA
jgi:hypothetical protein